MSAPGRVMASTVVPVDPRTDPRWLALASTAAGSLFTSPPWLTAVCDTYGFVPQARLAVDAGGTPSAGFAWVPITDIRGARISSLPFSDRAEPFGSNAGVWAELAREPLDSRLALTLRCLEGSPAADHPRLTRVGEAAWHGTPLHGMDDEILAGLTSETRRNIRIAARRDVTVVASVELAAVHELHRLHVALRKRKYRLLAQPVGFFERLWAEFAPREEILTLLAYDGDRVIGGALYLVWNDVLYYKFSASVGECLSLHPNEAIGWTAIQWATRRGLTLLDWGLSDLDQPGLLSYKRKWGSVERRIVTMRTAGPEPVPAAGRLLGEVTGLLTEDAVPDEVTARAGALLYRYFC